MSPIRLWRLHAGLSASYVADCIDVGQATLEGYELGRRRPRITQTRKLYELAKGELTICDIVDPAFALKIGDHGRFNLE